MLCELWCELNGVYFVLVTVHLCFFINKACECGSMFVSFLVEKKNHAICNEINVSKEEKK